MCVAQGHVYNCKKKKKGTKIVELEFNYDNIFKVGAKYFSRIAEYC